MGSMCDCLCAMDVWSHSSYAPLQHSPVGVVEVLGGTPKLRWDRALGGPELCSLVEDGDEPELCLDSVGEFLKAEAIKPETLHLPVICLDPQHGCSATSGRVHVKIPQTCSQSTPLHR